MKVNDNSNIALTEAERKAAEGLKWAEVLEVINLYQLPYKPITVYKMCRGYRTMKADTASAVSKYLKLRTARQIADNEVVQRHIQSANAQ
jgi:hypothetical protein